MTEDLAVAIVRELEELAAEHPQIVITLAPFDAWTLIGVLQLVLRHPAMTGASGDMARRMKDALIATVARSPTLAAVARMGDDPRFDS